MKFIKKLPFILIIFTFLTFVYVYAAVKTLPNNIGFYVGNTEKLAVYAPVSAVVSEEGIETFYQKDFFPTFLFKGNAPGRAELKISFCGFTLKTIKAAAIYPDEIVPSGQIVGMSEEGKSPFAGTVTFYNKETGKFGALAHGIDDDTKSRIIRNGKIFSTDPGDIINNYDGNMGSLSVDIYINRQSGVLERNTKNGVYGNIFETFPKSGHIPMKPALSSEVKKGRASIISDVEGAGVKDYDAEVVDIENGMFIINLKDDSLIAKTGGVVHGMSGTPIVQGGKIIGAVSAGNTDDPEIIYCVYVQDMLADFYAE